MPHDETKLPVWAQDLILGLRSRIEDQDEMVKYHNMRTEPTSVYWEKYHTGSIGESSRTARLYIPNKFGRLFIDLGKNRRRQEERLEISEDTGRDGTKGVRIRGVTGALRIMPEASNAIYITSLDPRGPNKD